MTIKGNEIYFEFDPFKLAKKRPARGNVRAARDEIKEFVLDSVLDKVGSATSPVKGRGKFKALSSAYKDVKGELSSSTIANLELTGDMLDSLEVVETRGGKLRLRIKGSEAMKADGHCNHSGKSKLPTRRFIPGDGETFKRDIIDGIREIVEDYG